MESIIGEIEGFPVFYKEKTDTIACKEISIPVTILLEAISSSLDRVKLEGDLMLMKRMNSYRLGCFIIENEKFTNLLNNLHNVRNQKKSKQLRNHSKEKVRDLG